MNHLFYTTLVNHDNIMFSLLSKLKKNYHKIHEHYYSNITYTYHTYHRLNGNDPMCDLQSNT